MTGEVTGSDVNGAASRRGGAPVGRLAELPEVEAAAVACLRLWCDGAESQARLWADLRGALGDGTARDALKAFERLVALLAREGRRPLLRHHRACACVGADEAVFAMLVAAAAEGDRDDATLLAAELAELAGAFGLALGRLSLCTAPVPSPASHGETLH